MALLCLNLARSMIHLIGTYWPQMSRVKDTQYSCQYTRLLLPNNHKIHVVCPLSSSRCHVSLSLLFTET